MTSRVRRLLEWRFGTWSRGKQVAAMTALSLVTSFAPATTDAHTFTGCAVSPCLLWTTELLSFTLTGEGIGVPLGRDPAGPTGPNGGYSFVSSDILITESATQASKGRARANHFGPGGDGTPVFSPPEPGQLFVVNSFFDVFFDVTLTDVDPVNNYFNSAPAITIQGLQGHMDFREQRLANGDGFPNFGLIPPHGQPYVGHFDIVVKIGADVNGNGVDDQVRLTAGTHEVLNNVTPPIIHGRTQTDTFGSILTMEGFIEDALVDPPWNPNPFTVSGLTTAQSTLVPSPGTLSLLLSGMGAVALRLVRRRS